MSAGSRANDIKSRDTLLISPEKPMSRTRDWKKRKNIKEKRKMSIGVRECTRERNGVINR